MRPLLQDAKLQAHVDEHGWVVVDLLTDSEVRAMVDGYDRLDHEITVDRSFAAGFHATIIDERTDYRVKCHDLIAGVFQPAADRIFNDAVLAMTNFVHKEPGAAAVPDHVDWTMVDEPGSTSLSVWSPLCDTDESSGCIGVLDRSHRAVSFVRASANPTYTETAEFGATLPGRELLPLKAGQAVVFDHRLVHFSSAHNGPEPRVAFTCEMTPRAAPLVHFEQLGSGRFRRHVVEPEFFTHFSVGQDPRDIVGHISYSDVYGTSFDQVWTSATEVEGTAEAAGSAEVSRPAEDGGPFESDRLAADTLAAGGVKSRSRRSIAALFRRARR